MRRSRIIRPALLTTLLLVFAGSSALADPINVLHEFDYTNGMDPEGSTILHNGFIYGMTEYGGTVSGGVIYRIGTDGSNFAVIHDFVHGEGVYPHGALTPWGGHLYGMTAQVSGDLSGVIFRIEPDGSNYSIRHTFDYRNDGGYPFGTLAYHDGYFYAFTNAGGSSYDGVIFRFDPITDDYTVLHHFNRSGTDGGSSYGSPIIVDDVIYGMTNLGGAGSFYDDGIIFRMNTNGTGFTILHSFERYFVDNGALPYGDLVHVDGWLYGLTRRGGTATGFGHGVAFRLDVNGSGFEILHHFLGSDYNPEGDDDGSQPYGSLALSGDRLVGMTNQGGGLGRGVIFSMKLDGSDYMIHHYFMGGPGQGAFPYYTTPTIAGSMLYACTKEGGPSGYGTVFSLEIETAVSVDETPDVTSARLLIDTAWPNPGRSGTATYLPLYLPEADAVALEIYHVTGRSILVRPMEALSAGHHTIRWNLDPLPVGTYYIVVRTQSGLEAYTRWTVVR